MSLDLEEDRRAEMLEGIQGFWLEEFDEELSGFRAERVLDYFLSTLGPPVYNQAVQDARAFIQRKLDDLDGEVYEPESR